MPIRFAQAAEKIHGTVLAVQADSAGAVIRHDAFAGMPSMTMSFRVVPRGALRRIHSGDVIDATVTRGTQPWTISSISLRSEHAVATPNIIRTVTPLQVGDAVPGTRFIDQTGHPFSFAQLVGRPIVLAFIYTRCKDPRMCPLISAKFNQLQAQFKDSQTHLVEITLDPQYDRPPVLAAYGRTFGARSSRWTIATGDPEEVLNFAAAFGLNVFPDEKLGLIHAERTAIVSPQARIATLIDDPGWSTAEIVAEVNAQSKRPANPLARMDLALSKAAVALCGDRVAGFSGLMDLAVVLIIFGSFGWLFFRLGKGILTSKA
ncbi:MAG: SCO family protein [Candidatus Eremiobacteraeota bacterium]|nr:SCO family protein [Candidatus Eremiobacteraeota bacterium]